MVAGVWWADLNVASKRTGIQASVSSSLLMSGCQPAWTDPPMSEPKNTTREAVPSLGKGLVQILSVNKGSTGVAGWKRADQTNTSHFVAGLACI